MIVREHRGTFEDSMRTCTEIAPEDSAVRKFFHIHPWAKMTFKFQGLDDRNGWNTYLVMADGFAAGFSNEAIAALEKEVGA